MEIASVVDRIYRASDNAPLMTWQEVIEHPSLRDMPFKIELNGDGNIVMSPTRNSHGGRQLKIGRLLADLMPQGEAATELAVQTSDGVRVTDAAWLTAEHWFAAEAELCCSTAPAICVEIASLGNSRRELNEKKVLYFEAGAQEVWFCDTFGNLTFYTTEGEVTASAMCPDFPRTV